MNPSEDEKLQSPLKVTAETIIYSYKFHKPVSIHTNSLDLLLDMMQWLYIQKKKKPATILKYGKKKICNSAK